MSSTHIYSSARSAFVTAIIIAVLGAVSYLAVEPSVILSANPHDFVITQTINDEISFLVEANDVTMVGSVSGLTGGYATGTATAVIQTNDPDGYTMTMAFSDDAAMQADLNADFINNYSTAVAAVADVLWIDNSSGGAGEFGYTVTASTTTDIDDSFLGAACAGGAFTADQCWMNPSTTAETIMVSSAAAASGATTTIKFKVAVPNSPSPSISAGTYTATATLTATNNP